MSSLAHDVRIAVRSLRQHGGVSAFIALSVALAIAGNATVFSIIGALMLRPFPYPEPERLTFVWDVPAEQPDNQSPLSPANYVDLAARARSFSQIAAFSPGSFHLTGGDQPEEVSAIRVTPGALEMLGFLPARGRTFRTDEGRPGNDRVVVLTHEIWQRRFGGDPKILGRTLQLDDESYAVVGVLPPGTEFLDFGSASSVWVPLALDPAELPRDQRSLLVMARVAPGVGLPAAKQEVEAIGRELAKAHPAANRGWETRAVTLREQVPGPTDRRIFTLMQAVMVLVLLIACANVANLLLARGQERQREIALRISLGAGRGRLVRQLLTESVLLALAGGALGLLLSFWGIRFLAGALAGQVPRAFLPQLDLPVLTFTAAIAVLAGLLFGLYPAFEASRPGLAGVLRSGGRGVIGARGRRRVIRGLVVAEIAFALGALSATGLLVQSMVALQTLDPGFDAGNVVTLRLALPERRYPDAAGAADASSSLFYRQVTERLAGLPGVDGVTAASALPRLRVQPTAPFTIEGQDGRTGSGGVDRQPEEIALSVLPSYFEVLRIPRLAGRGFTAADRPGGAPVALVSQAFAQRYFPGQDALGRRLTVQGRSREIVGVVADVVQSRIPGREGAAPMLYLPQSQTGARDLYLLLRTAASPEGLAGPLRAEVNRLDPALPVAQLATLHQRIREELVGPRVIAGVLAGFGAVALLLAGLGLYGVISYAVSQQTHEIGVRLAIGAQRRTVLGEVARQGALLTAGGLLLGIPLVYLAIKGISAALAGVVLYGLTTVPAIALLLGGVAALATALPARRAAALDPAIALRGD